MPVELSAPYLLVVDLEATCDEAGLPRRERETIEIGAVLVDATSLAVVKEFQSFVRPVRHPELSSYCVELTGIHQEDVGSAEGFEVVFSHFLDEMVTHYESLFVSWGGFDLRQLSRDCEYHGIKNPIIERLDLSLTFTEEAGLPRRPSMSAAMEIVGLSVEGSLHRGIDDARNLARLLPWCLGHVDTEPEQP